MIGCSPYTREKWERFEYLLGVHAKMCRLIMKKSRWADSAYSYFDFFAGPGLYTEADRVDLAGEYGSPVRAQRILQDVFRSDELAANGELLGVRSFLYDPHESARLQVCLLRLDYLGGHVSDLPCDKAVVELISQWPTLTGCCPWKAVGLAFFDPNGQPPWDAIKRFSRAKLFNRIDLLINVNATIGKRVRCSPIHDESKTPTQHLAELSKEDIYLWEPAPGDRHQFALAYCTNGPFPQFKSLGFHFLNTDKGKRIARRIDMTDAERKQLGGPLGFLNGMGDV